MELAREKKKRPITGTGRFACSCDLVYLLFLSSFVFNLVLRVNCTENTTRARCVLCPAFSWPCYSFFFSDLLCLVYVVLLAVHLDWIPNELHSFFVFRLFFGLLCIGVFCLSCDVPWDTRGLFLPLYFLGSFTVWAVKASFRTHINTGHRFYFNVSLHFDVLNRERWQKQQHRDGTIPELYSNGNGKRYRTLRIPKAGTGIVNIPDSDNWKPQEPGYFTPL